MSNGRKAKGGTSILKRLAGGDKTKTQERRMPKGETTSTERHPLPRERTTFLNPAPVRGRHERYRQYEHKTHLRENKPKVESERHREKVEEHKRKHPHQSEEGSMWML